MKKNIIKHISLTVVTMLAVNIATAQSFSNSPNDSIQMTGMFEDLAIMSILQLNTSTDTINLKWAIVSESVPANWDAAVCDNVFCYTSLADSGMMNPVIPGGFGLLDLHITPHVNYGTATICYAVWDITNPALRDTLTYILTVNSVSIISETENKSSFSIFPNPATNSINIISALQIGFEFFIADVSGKEMMKGISKTNSIALSTAAFPDGTYSISILERNKDINIKKFIVSH